MRDNSHPCYSCPAEAKTLCQGCAAKSCLDHLTPVKVPYQSLLLCSDCVDKQQKTTAVVALCLFVCFIIVLASAAN